jgi:LysR family hydrogen peroxide-inducible transcriptional activator
MNFQQLEYIVAVDDHKQFNKAADACFITTATLSMMIKKLENELGVKIFDRSKQPIITTDAGIPIVSKARETLSNVQEIKQLAKLASSEIYGEVRIGIIPTLAPYMSHLFIPLLLANYPNLKIKLFEWPTHQIVDSLIHNKLDIGIAATPLNIQEIKEIPLFNEPLIVYSKDAKTNKKQKAYLAPKDINIERLWLLEEEHCLRSQVLNLCSLKNLQTNTHQLEFEAGSIETLLRIVSMNNGITVIPKLALTTLSQEQCNHIYKFADPQPSRLISLITYRHFVKEKLIIALEQIIKKVVAPLLGTTTLSTKTIPVKNT